VPLVDVVDATLTLVSRWNFDRRRRRRRRRQVLPRRAAGQPRRTVVEPDRRRKSAAFRRRPPSVRRRHGVVLRDALRRRRDDDARHGAVRLAATVRRVARQAGHVSICGRRTLSGPTVLVVRVSSLVSKVRVSIVTIPMVPI